jgi:hypothetical protein
MLVVTTVRRGEYAAPLWLATLTEAWQRWRDALLVFRHEPLASAAAVRTVTLPQRRVSMSCEHPQPSSQSVVHVRETGSKFGPRLLRFGG